MTSSWFFLSTLFFWGGGNFVRDRIFHQWAFFQTRDFFDSRHLAKLFLEDGGFSTRNRITDFPLYTLTVNMDTSDVSEM